MTKRYISPQSGPVDIKTDKDSHYRSQEHTEAAEVQNEAPLSDLEDLKTNYVDMYVHRQLPHYAPIMRLVAEAERQFEHSLRKVKAKAWREGHRVAWEASGDGWNGEVNGISSNYDELVRRGMFEDNPYESEEA
ncbi:MAG: hypothetical protein SOH95_06655 [Bifidobacterium crudilactis]|jgi:hypothetical protein